MKSNVFEGSAFIDEDDFVRFSRDFIRKHKQFLLEYIQTDESERRKIRAFMAMIDDGKVEIDEVIKH
ncbi:MAG: hypothetical protein JW765_05215 [Deltaproteobacteria bacterium]|nr:hypothetical protein [Candidatus Zymogenaceae bacterium]